MFKYNNPLEENSGAQSIASNLNWPTEYNYPDFLRWERQTKGALIRNIIATHLREQGVSISEIAKFLGITDSRARIIIKKTELRLFGEKWANLPKVIEFSKSKSASDPRWHELSEFYTRYMQARTEAILYAINRSSYRKSDVELFARAGILITQITNSSKKI